jgi:hypothetical protein
MHGTWPRDKGMLVGVPLNVGMNGESFEKMGKALKS